MCSKGAIDVDVPAAVSRDRVELGRVAAQAQRIAGVIEAAAAEQRRGGGPGVAVAVSPLRTSLRRRAR